MSVKEKINTEGAAAPHLPAQVSVVHVTHEQRLGGEGVRLHVHVGSGHLTTREEEERLHHMDFTLRNRKSRI